jgi:hypothetical protein
MTGKAISAMTVDGDEATASGIPPESAQRFADGITLGLPLAVISR